MFARSTPFDNAGRDVANTPCSVGLEPVTHLPGFLNACVVLVQVPAGSGHSCRPYLCRSIARQRTDRWLKPTNSEDSCPTLEQRLDGQPVLRFVLVRLRISFWPSRQAIYNSLASLCACDV